MLGRTNIVRKCITITPNTARFNTGPRGAIYSEWIGLTTTQCRFDGIMFEISTYMVEFRHYISLHHFVW